jgi:FtsZ-binding cell division protein ZapB
LKSEITVDFTDDNITPIVTHHNNEVNIAFYKPIGEGKEVLALQITADKLDLLALPNLLLTELGQATTDHLQEEIKGLKYECDELLERNEKLEIKVSELEDIIEQYEENNQAYREKIRTSEGLF